MPGISIYLNENNQQLKQPILQHFPNYYCKNIFKNDTFYIDTVQYKGYPIKYIETKEYIIIIEGSIFPWEEIISNQIIHCYEALIRRGDSEPLKTFIHTTDGEYIITIFHRASMKIIVFNDYLGRLPLYYSIKHVALSREISFIIESFKPELDEFAVSDYLLFGYPLGDSSLYQDVKVLMPGSVIIYNSEENNISVLKLVELNFERSISSNITVKEAASSLYELFLESCKNRTENKNNILLSLSGGLDSRAILSAFEKLDIDYQSATYKDKQKTADADIKIVNKLMAYSNKPFRLIELDSPNNQLEDVLFGMKQGMNYLGMSFILDYFNKIQNPGLSFFTGDGGDKVMPNLHPLRPLFSKGDLANYIISHNQIFDLTEVSELTGIHQIDLKERLMKILNSYPEKSLGDKHIHFMMMERGFKWLFEGEDRNRYYFDQQSPFYSVHFYQYSMQLNPSLKRNFSLFKEFLKLLNLDIASINNANWGFSINSTNKIRWIYGKQAVKSMLPQTLINPRDKNKRLYPIEEYIKASNSSQSLPFEPQDDKGDYLRTLVRIMNHK